MKKRIFFILAICSLLTGSLYGQRAIKGKIYSKEGGVKGVVVTDGKYFASTSADGRFTLNTDVNQRFVYYSLPSGYESPIENGIPLFYRKLNPDVNTTYNFELTKLSGSQQKHTFVVWADPQVSEEPELRLLDKVVDHMIELRKESKTYWHGISCGDLVFDRLNLFGNYKKTICRLPFPFYQVIGNHDLDYSDETNSSATSSFCNSFGPDYYSYNVGDVHYIILNDVFYYGYKYHYMGYLDQYQLDWLKKDLSYVKQGATVVVALHIPSMYNDKDNPSNMEVRQKNSIINNEAFYKCLKGYKVHILAGHSHTQWNTVINDSILEHTHAAVSAAWWQGEVALDGTPKGYTIYEIEGDNVKSYFKGVGLGKEEQFKVYPVGADVDNPTAFIANVYNYDSHWKVEWYEDDVLKGEMEQFWGIDPLAKRLYEPGKNKKYSWLSYDRTNHLFRAAPTDVDSQIKVVVTDRFGQKYTQVITK